MDIFIYGLIDPRQPEHIRYVGKSNNPARRLTLHLHAAKNGKQTHKDRWIRKLLREGVRPKFVILEKCSEANWQEAEKRWIAKLNNLTNITIGGDGIVGVPRTKVWAARIGAAHKGMRHSPETRKHLSEINKAKHDHGCRNGHPWTLANTSFTKEGHRECLECRRIQDEKDRRSRGALPRAQFEAQRKPATHCKRGHPMNGGNLRLLTRKSGHVERICRQCVRDRNRECKRRKRSAHANKRMRK